MSQDFPGGIMPKIRSNDELVREVRERRRELIQEQSRLAAEQIGKLLEGRRKPSIQQIAGLIADQFLGSPI
jgi:hypothetical protein